LKVEVSVGETSDFGPEINVAKALIDECVQEWSKDADDNIQALVAHAFQLNKAGRYDKARVLGLRTINIDRDKFPQWAQAMEAVSDAVRPLDQRMYIRFYDVNPDTGAQRPISLDLASI